MNIFTPILAEAGLLGAWSSLTEEARTRLFTVTAFAAVILAIFVWAAFIRKQRTKRRRIYKQQPHTWQQSEDGNQRRRRRHQRQRHRRNSGLPQNPSLADAGGLPPRRPDDVPPAGT